MEACSREVLEELGLTLPLGPLLVVDWAPAEAEGDKILFIFDGGTLTADQLSAIRLQPAKARPIRIGNSSGSRAVARDSVGDEHQAVMLREVGEVLDVARRQW